MKILIDLYNSNYKIWQYPMEHFVELQNEFPAVAFIYINSRELLTEYLPNADAIIGWRISPEDLKLACRLKWFHTMAAGINTMFYEDFLKSDVILTNSAEVRAAPMADWVICQIISLAKNFPMFVNARHEEKWARYDYWNEIQSVIDLDKSTLGIIGYGGIGRETAKRAKACGMSVLASKRNISTDTEYADEIFPHDSFDPLIKRSDFILLSAPLTPETEKMFGKREFSLMKPTAYLLNVGRGKLVDTEALIEALTNRTIAGCALDVTDPEPPETGSPLWTLDNVILTPHISGIGPNFWQRSQDLIVHNIRAFLGHGSMRNVVDLKLQY